MLEIVSLLGEGLLQSFEPLNLFMIFAGCLAGLFIGAMPGLGSVNGVAILLPVTFLVPPTSAIIFLAALYYGAMYGGLFLQSHWVFRARQLQWRRCLTVNQWLAKAWQIRR